MSECSVAQSEVAKNWPEGIISVKLTMNPYLLAMAIEKSLEQGMRLWEFINLALWERLGKPDRDALTEFAASMEVHEEDPKWAKRLNITARHEVAVKAWREAKEETAQAPPDSSDGDGEAPER